MTSASELFYQRRSRVGRNNTSNSDLGIDGDRNFHLNYTRRHQNNHHRHDFDGCDPTRRSSAHVRSHRLSSPSDRALVRLDQGSSQLSPSSNTRRETLRNASRPRSTGNDRLPGAVLLARARLLERLSGVSLSGNRRSSRASFGIYNREFTFGDDLRVVDVGDWGADIAPGRSSSRGTPFTYSIYSAERQQWTEDDNDLYKKKPPGLTPADFECLQLEIFGSSEKGAEGEVSSVLRDCSICLESFKDGDKLIRLQCDHRFHSSCLDPWVRTCGDCPYCRRDIAVVSKQS
ncbi:probable E3 ubiquitin-protein ligase RHY1A [Mercurialis annua]|uniref:probable E3 ubiquitin-protein ligase RHY1A n=1 Tax=Mercurialis annua TaxID=3986 RepID=UPI00215E9B16|nr:probable E3 ubiquitin-protein ligase RHY1A [Mercurialis annua]